MNLSRKNNKNINKRLSKKIIKKSSKKITKRSSKKLITKSSKKKVNKILSKKITKKLSKKLNGRSPRRSTLSNSVVVKSGGMINNTIFDNNDLTDQTDPAILQEYIRSLQAQLIDASERLRTMDQNRRVANERVNAVHNLLTSLNNTEVELAVMFVNEAKTNHNTIKEGINELINNARHYMHNNPHSTGILRDIRDLVNLTNDVLTRIGEKTNVVRSNIHELVQFTTPNPAVINRVSIGTPVYEGLRPRRSVSQMVKGARMSVSQMVNGASRSLTRSRRVNPDHEPVFGSIVPQLVGSIPEELDE